MPRATRAPAARARTRGKPAVPAAASLGARVAIGLAVAVSAYYALAYLFVALSRIGYPFELEWEEGIVLEHVQRVLAGQPIYVAPSLQFVPLNYTPLYWYVAAAFAKLLGPDFLALRVVSFLSSLACFTLLYQLVRRETGSRSAGAVAVGLFAATYRLGGAWLDIGRSDSLYLALLLGAATVLRFGRSRYAPVAAGALAALAALAKQSAVTALGPLALALFFVDPRRGLLFAATAIGLTGAGVLLLDASSHGWFHYYVFDVARHLEMKRSFLWIFPRQDVLRWLPIAVALSLAAVARHAPRLERSRAVFYAGLLAGLIGGSWQLRLYEGGYDNVLLTGYLGLAIGLGLAWAELVTRPASGGRAGRGWAVAAALAVVAQLGMLWWNPAAQIPTPSDRAAGEQLSMSLARLEGRVLVSSHSYMARRAGKPAHVHVMPFMAVVKGAQGPVERALLQSLRDTLAAHVFASLVLDNRDWLLDEAAKAGYEPRANTFDRPDVFWPVTGMRTRPQYVFLPKGSAPRDSVR